MFRKVLLPVFVLLSLGTLSTGQGQSYSTNYVYQSQSNGGSSCNDLLCPIDKCCIETHRGPICTALTTPPPAGGQVFCPRAKKCFSNNDCPSDFCCVQLMDVTTGLTCPKTTNNPYTIPSTDAYGSGYNIMGGYGTLSNVLPNAIKEGYCAPLADDGKTCFIPVPGSEGSNCPCKTAGKKCVTVMDIFPIGACR